MNRKEECYAYVGLIVFFLCILLLVRLHELHEIHEDLDYHAQALSSYAWNMDFIGMEEYLSLAVDNHSYESAAFYDDSIKRVTVKIEGPALGPFSSLLYRLGILQSRELRREVVYEEDALGSLSVRFYNLYVYTYAYVCLIMFLMIMIEFLIIRLFREREALEIRVGERTFELEKEIRIRRMTEKDLYLTLHSIADGVITTDLEGRISRLNPVAERLLGWDFNEVRGKPFQDYYKTFREGEKEEIDDFLKYVSPRAGASRISYKKKLISRTDEEYSVIESVAPIQSEQGDITGVVITIHDVTAEVKLQNQLMHSQRMDAIGQLAGGIAHDFNNMLGGIVGASELLSPFMSGNDEAEELNRMVLTTAMRASDLTKKLLTFSRKAEVKRVETDLHHLIRESADFLKRTIDKNIDVGTDLKAESFLISGDTALLENVLINMGINASHAMPHGGHLTFYTKNICLSREYCQNSPFELEPGDYLDLVIEDNGSGIPRDKLPHIFEPFFTTKERGKGTGLGLSTVYGTIQQHGGEIKVYSEVGVGTSFHIVLPLCAHLQTSDVSSRGPDVRGTGTILVVDDEEMMLLTACGILESFGYEVLTASQGQEGLQVFKEQKDRVDLVLVDLIMPVLGGRDCFRELRKLSPSLPVIMVSGLYNPEEISLLKEEGLNGFLSKPYRKNELGTLVFEVLAADRDRV